MRPLVEAGAMEVMTAWGDFGDGVIRGKGAKADGATYILTRAEDAADRVIFPLECLGGAFEAEEAKEECKAHERRAPSQPPYRFRDEF